MKGGWRGRLRVLEGRVRWEGGREEEGFGRDLGGFGVRNAPPILLA
jgi:hypothetical protein